MTDQQLIDNYQSTADDSYFAELVERHREVLIEALSRSYDTDRVEDALQAAVAKLFDILKRRPGYTNSNLRAWLYRVTWNELTDEERETASRSGLAVT